jgi:subtilisin family serine protease
MARSGWIALLAPLALLCASTAGAQDDARYMVKFKDFRGAAQAVAAAGGRVALELEPQGAVAAYLPAPAVDALRRNPNVEYVEVDPRRHPMAQTTPYGITMVQADLDPFPGSSQSNVTVCIIDSGYHRNHEDLVGNTVTGVNNSGTGNWDEDSCGHGSHVAGTIAAYSNLTGVVGASGNGSLNLRIQKVFNGADCGWAYSSGLVSALNNCRAGLPTSQRLVVNMSLGGSVSSRTEQSAFQSAYDAGVLSIAAAGNDGSTRKSYPASYPSVISVAAVDSNKVVASFSQKNDAVELAAPGVGVLSTTPFKPSSLTVGGSTYLGSNIDGSARLDVSGTLVSGGLCDSTNTDAWSGHVVLCQRGTNSFADKVAKVQSSGGLGTAIYNNVSGGFAGTLNGTSSIPAISLSMEDGNRALNSLSQPATLANTVGVGNGYEAWDGTSMATPHVSGVAALVWSQHPTKTNAEVRAALQTSAQDLGAAGKDNSYGYGLVQAKAAYDALAGSGGGGGGTPATITLSVKKTTTGKKVYADLAWSGATTANVDIFRNGAKITTTANDGAHRDTITAGVTYTYKVCNAGSATTCSSDVTIN